MRSSGHELKLSSPSNLYIIQSLCSLMTIRTISSSPPQLLNSLALITRIIAVHFISLCEILK